MKKKSLRTNPVDLMIHRLSLLWKEKVEWIEDNFTAEDIIRYQCLYELEPWGSEADDLRFQQLCYVTAQSNSPKKLDPKDFVMPWRKPRRQIVPYDVGITAHIEHIKRSKKTT